MIRLRLFTIGVFGVLAVALSAQTEALNQQSSALQVFTLEDALRYAVDHYPTSGRPSNS